MDVLPGDSPTGPDVHVGNQQFAAGVLGANANYHPLAGDRVLDNISRL
jgi:hypothetical protein